MISVSELLLLPMVTGIFFAVPAGDTFIIQKGGHIVIALHGSLLGKICVLLFPDDMLEHRFWAQNLRRVDI